MGKKSPWFLAVVQYLQGETYAISCTTAEMAEKWTVEILQRYGNDKVSVYIAQGIFQIHQ